MKVYLLPVPNQRLLISDFMGIHASLTRLQSCSLNRSITIWGKTQLSRDPVPSQRWDAGMEMPADALHPPDPNLQPNGLGSFPACFLGGSGRPGRHGNERMEQSRAARPRGSIPGWHVPAARGWMLCGGAGSRDGRRIPPGLGRALGNQQLLLLLGTWEQQRCQGRDGGRDPVAAL